MEKRRDLVAFCFVAAAEGRCATHHFVVTLWMHTQTHTDTHTHRHTHTHTKTHISAYTHTQTLTHQLNKCTKSVETPRPLSRTVAVQYNQAHKLNHFLIPYPGGLHKILFNLGTDEFLENFQRGGGGHFPFKKLYCRFWTFIKGFLDVFRKFTRFGNLTRPLSRSDTRFSSRTVLLLHN